MRGLVLVLAALAVSLAGGDAAFGQPAPTPPKPPAAPAVAPLSESMAVGYFQTGDAKKGADAFAQKAWKDARTAFDAARKTAKGDDAARLDVMLGLCNEELGNWARAAQQLEA